MRKLFPIALCVLLFAACNPNNPNNPEPNGVTVQFAEIDSIFPNPERGLFVQIYYTSADLNAHASATTISRNRETAAKLTLYLHSYYLTDYMESDIPQEFLDRLEVNMNALREGGAKAVLRFSYKYSMDKKDQPWNATAEWIHRHIDQLTPYLQKHADVIYTVQCGFLGSWGEWYYVDNGYKFNPSRDEDFVPRWEVLEHLLRALPETRQVALRVPAYKMRYLKMHGDTTSSPLTASEAHNGSFKARISGHNDCFVSSQNDVGTYIGGNKERDFWAEDTKYTVMGGETCEKHAQSKGENALKQMARFHWSYLNRDYREEVTNMWRGDGTMDTILTRIGYRLALEKVIITPKPQVNRPFEMYCVLNNRGFAAPMNPRDVELIFVNAKNPAEKHVFKQTVDPRFWIPEETHKFTLACTLSDMSAGQYKLYLNLPDPYPSLHNDPRYSIRLANADMWEPATGYNYITTVTVE